MPEANQSIRVGSAANGFAALGDPTRLALLTMLSDGDARSITELSSGFDLSRQAITKHLRILEAEQLITGQRAGRETRFALQVKRLDDLGDFLQTVSQQWDQTLNRLREHLETE